MGIAGNEDVLTVVQRDALGADGGGHDGQAPQPGVENLDAHPASGEERHNEGISGLQMRHWIGHIARYLNARISGQCTDIRRRLLAGDHKAGIGNLLPDERQHLTREPEDASHVGRPEHGAEVENGGWGLGRRDWRLHNWPHLRGIDADRDCGELGSLQIAVGRGEQVEKEAAVFIGDGQHRVVEADHVRLVAAECTRFALGNHAAQPAGFRRHPVGERVDGVVFVENGDKVTR